MDLCCDLFDKKETSLSMLSVYAEISRSGLPGGALARFRTLKVKRPCRTKYPASGGMSRRFSVDRLRLAESALTLSFVKISVSWAAVSAVVRCIVDCATVVSSVVRA